MNITDRGHNNTEFFTMSPFAYFSVGLTVMIFGIFGLCANVVSVVMFIKESKFRTSVDALLLNLAVADIGITSVCFPFIVSSNFAQHWLQGDVGCTVYGFLSFLFGNASITTLTVISVERYFIVCKKSPASILERRLFLMRILLFIWMQAFVWAMLPIITGVDYSMEPFQTSCTVNWKGNRILDQLFILGLVVVVIGGNTIVMLYCYIRVLITAKKEHAQRRMIQDVVLTKVCFLLVIGFFLCWAPYAIVSMWGAYGDADSIPHVAQVVPVVLAKMSTCINPILYILVSKKFRKRYFDVLRCKRFNRLYPSHIVTIQTNLRHFNATLN